MAEPARPWGPISGITITTAAKDLFVTVLTNERFLLFRNTGRGQFADMGGSSRIASLSLPWTGWSAGIFDFNNDGLKDIFSANGNVNDNGRAHQ
jgi:hypothetical protein